MTIWTPVVLATLAGGASGFAPSALWEAWPERRFVATAAPCLRHAQLVERLEALEARHPGRLALEVVGRSVEGRSLHLLSLGRGPRRILLWSQMHGDEPSATPALLDVADFLLRSREPEAAAILDGLTLLMVPMLNPDGAERYERRNAQGIDINRDALNLVTPEGRLLKALRDRFRPELGFNLHDQNRRTTVGESGMLSTISLLAVAGDAEQSMNPGRLRAKRVCSAIVSALAPLLPGRIARYDEDWNPRAFGDNLTAWGTPVVLVESGGLEPDRPLTELTRLNFVALLTVFSGLVEDDLAGHDPALYEALARTRTGEYVDVMLAGGQVWQPPLPAPYRADVAFDRIAGDRTVCACPGGSALPTSSIAEVGDGRQLRAGRTLDVSGKLIVPGFAASIRGLAARGWLSAARLDAIACLGVVALRWHVDARERATASQIARDLAREDRPAIEVVDAAAPPRFLGLDGPPRAPASTSLEDVLDALTAGRWREGAGGRAFVEVLADLTGRADGASEQVPARIRPQNPASLLVLRPGPQGLLDPRETRLEAVFVDGSEPSPSSCGMGRP